MKLIAKIAKVLVLVLLLFFLVAGGWFWYNFIYLSNQRASLTPEDIETYVPPMSEQYYNVLLLGVDKEGMADVIVLVSVNFFSDYIVLTSISRDTFVENQNWAEAGTGASHLSFASYVGMEHAKSKDYKVGAANAAYWVEELFGVVIHDYALITNDGFIDLIDLIGGVEIDVNPAFAGKRIKLSATKVVSLPTGLQRLSGEQTLAFSRYRGDDEDSRIPETGSNHFDGDRMVRNQQLLKAIYQQLKSLKISQVLGILKEMPKYVHTSVNLVDLTSMAPKLHRAQFNEIITIVIPGELVEVYEEKAGDYTNYFMVDFTLANDLLEGLGLIWDK